MDFQNERRMEDWKSCNSLQTVRGFRTPSNLPPFHPFCFGSLQTVRTFRILPIFHPFFVSIPFKRKVFPNSKSSSTKSSKGIMFQFPSNGKVFPNVLTDDDELIITFDLFQFPSNGKVFPNSSSWWTGRRRSSQVSIPFKREGVSEQHPLRTQSQCGLKLPKPNATEFRDFFG